MIGNARQWDGIEFLSFFESSTVKKVSDSFNDMIHLYIGTAPFSIQTL